MARVAFVGLGTMGLPMARHLVAAGHEVVACDVDRDRAAVLGGPVATTPAEAVADSEAVLTSLPSLEAVEEVMLGPDGVRAGARPGTLAIDLSTSSPALARGLVAELVGLSVLDAPVSGGPRGAVDGTLTVMVGGAREDFERARPLFDAIGSLVVHVGPSGAGQAAKLCNNLIAGSTMVAVAEACAIAEHEGLDPRTLYELLSASTGDSRVLRTRFPLAGADAAHPSSNDYAPLFALDLIAKDLGLALELAAEHGVDGGVASTALAAYATAQRAGHGDLDYSAVFLTLPRRSTEE